ncbi:terminase large subunit [Lactobacillus amylolyticus]|uniref:terminase large subunit n=1 Tax=Lactobacillus amylolyticus TaxID=83683 RepID=UPI002491C1FE|nr:terminase TerL endonuclease subunit [Lactobacillus amylolyticus]
MEKIEIKNKDVIGTYQKQNYNAIAEKYRDPATKYAFKVLNGEILAGYKIKLACFRHLQDLKRSEEHDISFPYHYDLDECKKILNFARLCPDVNVGKPLPLLLWQKAILCLMIGWRDELNHKRFTRVSLSVARTNGKTYLVNIMLWYAYMIEAANKFNQDLAYIGPVAAQAKKGWRYVEMFGHKLSEIPAFKKQFFDRYGVDVQSEQVKGGNTQNNILRMSNESGQFDSYHFLFCVADEAGDTHYTSDNFSKITSGQVQTPNHQFVQISTAYDDPTVPFHSDQLRMTEMMEKDYQRSGDEFLVLVWEQDSPNELDAPETWIKSNPILMIKNNQTMIKGLQTEKDNKLNDGTINDFKNRNLNMWMQLKTATYLKLSEVENSIVNSYNIKGQDVYIGFDSSMFSDNTALAFIFPFFDERKNKQKFFIMQHSFIPFRQSGSIEIKEKQDGIKYRKMVDKGFCTITAHPQGLINIEQVYDWLVNFVNHNNLNVKFFGYDRMGDYRVKELVKTLDANFDWPLLDVAQRTSEIGDPTKFLQERFADNSILMLNDPVLKKALLNAETYEDKIGMQVDKAKATYKIDAVDALIDAMYQAMYATKDYGPLEKGKTEVERMTDKQMLAWYMNPESGLLGGDDDDF